jgi:L-ascorbate metabolism protein UlaG (beta-lactamase superfamily)
MIKQFGGKVTRLEIAKYSRSKHWDGKKFNNLEETKMDIPFRAFPKLLFSQLFKKKQRLPFQEIKVPPFNATSFLAPAEHMKFIWYGHSAILMRLKNKTILIDPMFGSDAAPIAPFSIKRFNTISTAIISDFPEIDVLLMSHDHYDHLDLKSIQLLKGKVKKFFVALGVGRHLISWGVDPNSIVEFDWWEKNSFEDIEFAFTPTRHFSGRAMKDRFKGLWGGWVIKTDTENIWFSGDGGFGVHFKEIGDKLGPFDFAFMECGQYNKLWRPIHLFPDECIQAAIDAKAKKIMPVHWGSFNLSDHSWTEPANQFVEECEKSSVPYLTPMIGELITPMNQTKNKHWWEELV